MHKRIIFGVLFVITIFDCHLIYAQDFQITKILYHSEFDTVRISNMDSLIGYRICCFDSIFVPVQGPFDIYVFERYRYGLLKFGEYGFSHEVIFAKVENSYIVESFFVDFDWREPPYSYPILWSKKRVPLSKRIPVARLRFSNYCISSNMHLIESSCYLIFPKSFLMSLHEDNGSQQREQCDQAY